jgi:hypothetical protein
LEAELAEYISTYGEDYGRAKFEQEYLCSFEAANLGAILARALGIAEKEWADQRRRSTSTRGCPARDQRGHRPA